MYTFFNGEYRGHVIQVEHKYGVYITKLDGAFYASDDNWTDLQETVNMLKREIAIYDTKGN